MEAVHASSHFSANTSLFSSTSKSKSKPNSTRLCSSWTAFSTCNFLSSKNHFTREIWSRVNYSRRDGSLFQRRDKRLFIVRAEMFGQLTSGLEAAWTKLKGEETLTKENIVEPMRDIRRALLEADVSLPVVRRFVQAVSDQAVGVGLIRGVRPDQQLVKV